MPRKLSHLSLSLLVLGLWLAACSQAEPVIYRPPTLVPSLVSPPQSSPTPEASPAVQPLPTTPPVASCTNNLTFIEDLTIPDGSQVAPNQALDKQWRVQNSGTCNWDASYRLELLSGPDLGVPAQQMLYPARGGSEFTIQMVFTAPAEPGSYQSAWQALDPQGSPFGEPIFIQFTVSAP